MKERDEHRATLLLKDPNLPWPGEFPYESLNRRLREAGHPGLNTSSTAKEIKDALFDLMAVGIVSAEARLAWDELRLPERRLVLDFFMYAFETGEESIWSDALCELPMPLEMPDFRELADGEPEYEKTVSLPSFIDPVVAPKFAPVDADLLTASPVDIGPVSINEAEVLGDEYGR
jgi:hypothetical protein